jgi:hypothetical protein
MREEGISMQLDKNMIVDLLRQRGDHQSADQADQELPDQVDTDQHAGMLERFGLDPKELASRFTGGSGLPGV